MAIRNKGAASAFLILFGLTAGVVAGELMLRAVLPAPVTWTYPQVMYEFDPVIGHRLKPDQVAHTHDNPVRTNTLGLRDRDFPPVAESGTVRILALGDSQTFGNGLPLEQTWPKQLETALQGRQEVNWEVINGGVPGTDTWQHAVMLERWLPAYQPDIVVLAFYVNDVATRFTPSPTAVAQMSNTLEKRIGYKVKESLIFLTAHQAYSAIRQGARADELFKAEQAIIKAQTQEELSPGWQEVKRSLGQMKALCDQNDVQLLMVVLPRRDQVSGEAPAKQFHDTIAEIAAGHEIPLIPMLPDLQAAYREEVPLFIPWDGHNNGAANAVIAARLADVVAVTADQSPAASSSRATLRNDSGP